MKNKMLKGCIVLGIYSLISCTHYENSTTVNEEVSCSQKEEVKIATHNYGGWYCPDNLKNFPAIDIRNWETVPVVNGRMATKEETRNGKSLIYVDMEKYPNAKTLDLTMPKLARFYNRSAKREDLIIVIQALNIEDDSVVGFRYLNGGNGSANMDEVTFLTDSEIEKIPTSKYVTHSVKIKSTQEEIWKVLTNPENTEKLQKVFDEAEALKKDWRNFTNVNYAYLHSGKSTARYGDKLYGCYYIQNNYDRFAYVEKFLLLENQETHETELKIVCGPFTWDYAKQKEGLNNWAQKVKELSEN